jgi:hypothetical protein
MAKKNSFEAFLADVLSHVPEDRRGAVEEALAGDALSELEKGYRRQSDYSREMDRIRQREQELDATLTEANERVAGWQDWYNTASQEYEDMKRQVAMTTAEDELPPQPKAGITKEDLAAELAARDRMAIAFADVLTDIKIEHKERFHEKLDTQKLTDFALKRGLPIDAAYREFIAPKEEELRSAELEKRIAAAREEGAREYATKHRLPVVSGPIEQHPLDLVQSTKTNPSERVAAAISSWNSAQHTP